MEDSSRKTIGNPETLRRLNRLNILNLLRNAGSISRTEVGRRSGLGWGSVTKYVNELIAEGYLTERQTAKNAPERGRRPGILELNNESRRIVGVDVSDHVMRLVMCDFSGNPLLWREAPTPSLGSAAEITGVLCREIRELLDEGLEKRELFAIGVGVAGAVDWEHGIVRACTNMPYFNEVPLRRLLAHRFGCRVHLSIDMRTLSLGEQVIGHAGDLDNFLVVYLGYGIGSNVVLKRRSNLYENQGCDCGHYIVRPAGHPCICGMRGCLEAEAGIGNLLRQLPGRDFDGLCRGFADGDPECRNVLDVAFDQIAETLAAFVQFYHPQKILLHGELTRLGEALTEALRERISRRLPEHLFVPEHLLPSRYWRYAAPVGAVELVWLRELGLDPDYSVIQLPPTDFRTRMPSGWPGC